MPDIPIDERYGQFGGADGWGNTNRAVYIDIEDIPDKYLDNIEDILILVIDLVNFMFNTRFHYDGRIQGLNWSSQGSWNFIGIRFNPVGAYKLAEAGPSLDTVKGVWQGGHLIIYPKTYNPIKLLQRIYGAFNSNMLKRTLFRVMLHEFGHILGTIHCNLNPSLLHTTKNTLAPNGFGYMPWDLAVITKFMLGFDKGESAPFPIWVKSNPHLVRFAGEGWLYVPLVYHNLKRYTAIFQEVPGGWKMYGKWLWDKMYFTDYQHYNFSNTAFLSQDYRTLELTDCFVNGQIENITLYNQDNGLWIQRRNS